jgi:hypothetical protein
MNVSQCGRPLTRAAPGIARLVAVAIAAAMLWPALAVHASLSGDDLPNLNLPILSGGMPSEPGVSAWTPPPLTPGDFEYDPIDGVFKLVNTKLWGNVWGGLASIELLELEFHPNPYVLNNILVTNNSAVTQSFNILVALPTTFGSPNQILGSITTQVIDGTSGGATLTAPANGSVYQAIIDGTTVATLQDDPFVLVAPAAGVNNDLESFGPAVNGLAVTSYIAIELNFTLSPGDSAAILSRFDVIPEPASLALLGVASILLVGRRRH